MIPIPATILGKFPSSAKNPGEFDYRNFLKRKGILKTFYVNNVPFEILKSPSVEDIFKADGFTYN